MKILILTGSYPSEGNPLPSIFVHNQAKALQKMGYEVAVLLFDMRSLRKKRKFLFSEYTFDEIHVYRYAIPCGPIPYLLEYLSFLATKRGFKHIMNHFGKPDLIHAHFSGAGYCASGIKKQFSIPYVLTEHGSNIIAPKLSKETIWFAKKAYYGADKLIAVGTMLKKSMERLTDKSITVIPNILPDTFHIIDSVIKENVFTFITVGNLIKSKRMDLTISAFAKLYEENNGVQLKIVGEGPLKKDLLKLVKVKKVDNVVEFLGRIPNEKMPEFYNRCHCFVLPSEAETFGVVYAEAAACGLPVIATDCGGSLDIVNPSNGIIILKKDIDILIKAMNDMYSRKKRLNKLRVSKDVIDRFGENHFLESMTALYEELILND